jgi:hypothetical protein
VFGSHKPRGSGGGGAKKKKISAVYNSDQPKERKINKNKNRIGRRAAC